HEAGEPDRSVDADAVRRLPAPVLVLADALLQRPVAVPGPADDRQNAAAALGRDASRLEDVHGFLPGIAAGRLFLSPRHHGLVGPAPPGALASGRPDLAGANPERDRGPRLARLR